MAPEPLAPPRPPPSAGASPAGAPGSPPAEGHLARLRELVRLRTAGHPAPRRRRGQRPTALQCLQETVRQEAVDCYRALRDQGQTLGQCGRLLQLAPRTLRFWDRERGPAGIGLVPVGRPVTRSPLPVRQAILDFLKLTGPGIGVPSVQEHFADVPRAELADLLERYRAVWRARHPAWPRVLHWQTPGRVWAADFTQPSRHGAAALLPPIAGRYPYVVAVRDLASGLMLAWQPLPDLTKEVTVAALARLVALFGAPLVLKMDNGSAFRAAPTKEFLEGRGVIPLYSPPSCPGYNGAIEAAIGSLKKRTAAQAQQEGRSGRWEEADLAAAQAEANASHPRRLNGRTPRSVWEAGSPIDALERIVFELTVERQRLKARTELRLDPEEPLDHWRASAVDRLAIDRALVEHGHLLFTRRRIPLRITARKVTADG